MAQFCTCAKWVAPSSGTLAVSGIYWEMFFSLLNRWRNHLCTKSPDFQHFQPGVYGYILDISDISQGIKQK